MLRKIASGLIVTLVLVGLVSLAFNIQSVLAGGTIYIRADGSVEGTTDISTVDNVTYTLTNNIYDEIVIEKNDTVLDGFDYTLQGSGNGSGVFFVNVRNVTIKNMNIEGFGRGIFCMASSHCNIVGNKLSDNYASGIEIHECYEAFNHIEGNNVTNTNEYGILLIGSKNTFRENQMIDNRYNFGIWGSLQNDVDTSNTVNGKPVYYWVDMSDMTVPSNAGLVVLMNCTRITVQNLNLVRNSHGVILISTANSTISQNYMANNNWGLEISSSSDNTISRNTIEHNDDGIFLSSSNNNLMKTNNISSNLYYGIAIYSSDNNRILENNIMHNNEAGIHFSWSYNNEIYHNNFVNNVDQIYIHDSINSWDDGYPSGGNYWSNYPAVDAYSGSNQDQLGSDGIGDTSHVIDGNNQDNFPLMGPFSFFNAGTWGETTYQVDTISNSTVSNFQFTETEKVISFDVAGPDGTTGFCRVITSNALLGGPYVVLINDAPPTTINEQSNGTHTFLYFTYNHSVKSVEISGTTVIPEFSRWISILLLLTVISVALVMYKRRLPKTSAH